MQRNFKILTCTLVGLGFTVVAYSIWNAYQDHQTLQKIQAQKQAFADYRQQANQSPTDPQVQLKLGDAAMLFWQNAGTGARLALQSGQWDSLDWIVEKPRALKEAAIAYKTALKLDPQLTKAQVGLCHALLAQEKQGQEATVTATCRKATESQPPEPDAYLFLGIALSRQSQWVAAETALRQYLALTPDQGNGYYQLGKVLLAQQKYDPAIAAYQKAIALDPQANLPHVELGDAYSAQGKTDAAIAAYRKALDVTPNYPPAYLKLGDLLLQNRKTGEAIATYRQMIQQYPNLASGYSGLGRALTGEQKWDAAIAAHNKAIELDPSDPWNFSERGTTLAKQNKLDGAVADYSKAIELDSSNMWVLVDRGSIYARQGKSESAFVDFNRAVQLQPNSVTALNALCWHGSLLGQAKQVISFCEKAVAAAPPQERDFYRDSRGLARAMTGNPQGAIADFQSFIQWTRSNAGKASYEPGELQKRATRRQTWIQALQNNQNPFTLSVQQDLFRE